MARITVVALIALSALVSVALGSGEGGEEIPKGKAEIPCSNTGNNTCPKGCECVESACGNSTIFAKNKTDVHAAHLGCLMDEENVCFPAFAQVELASGKLVSMDKLQIGDRVLVSSGIYSEIVMFTHSTPSSKFTGRFVRLATAAGPTITLTRRHFIPVSGKLVAAESVQVGDVLRLANGGLSPVVSKDEVVSSGLYNPQTAHGEIAVEGVVASTYTETVPPQGAHALLAPVRALFGTGATFACHAFSSVFA